jgi:predicted HTH transcriptional regulator
MNSKSLKEEFAKSLENPDRVDFRNIVKNHNGEQAFIDFKASWIEPHKLAKHIIAMANSEGGAIIFGLEEKDGRVEIIGLQKTEDQANIKTKLAKYIPDDLEYDILNFEYADSEYGPLVGKSFQLVNIYEQNSFVPFLPKSDGTNICKNRVYVRRGTETTEANYIELQKIINRRIDLNYSSSGKIEIEEHLVQLKTLYAQIKKNNYLNSLFEKINLSNIYDETIPNKNYPDEDFEQFIVRMIFLKKQIIENELRK